MAYIRPGITLVQNFQNTSPELAPFNLPSTSVGAAYQLVTAASAGTYDGTEFGYAYPGLLTAAIPDTVAAVEDDPFPTASLPVVVSIQNAVLDIVDGSGATGTGTAFHDATSSVFQYVKAGDKLTIGSHVYVIKTVTDDNNLVLQSPLLDTAPYTYGITRIIASVPIARGGGNGFTLDTSAVTLPDGLTDTVDSHDFDIVGGTVLITYRALRTDLASTQRGYTDIADINAVFGTNQITPANPLAYALSIMLQNTTTEVFGLGLDDNAVDEEVLSHQAATAVLDLTNTYAICVLTQNPAVHQVWASNVTSLSAQQKERICLINRLIKTEQSMQDESTTVTTLAGSLIIVNTATTGSAAQNSTTFHDATSSKFQNVQLGDTVVVTGGTNAIPGNYTVMTHTDNNNLVLSSAVATAGAGSTIAYYIVRKDGLWSDGQTFYDRNATFISDGVAPGDFLRIDSGGHAGNYEVATVISDVEITIAQVPGVTTLVTAVDYDIYRNMTKDAQAAFLAGVSTSYANRRVVNVWPDSLQGTVGNQLKPVKGFYAGCAIGALVTGLPTQQGFTNMSVSGFLGCAHSTGYFNDTQLDTIAGGGTLIFIQPTPDTALVVRHQLTTDTSAVKFQELSITKNVDYISKFLRSEFAHYVGLYNIVTSLFDDLKRDGTAAMKYLKENTIQPNIGGVINSGVLSGVVQSQTNIDRVAMTFSVDIPIPLNGIDITLNV